MPEYCDGTAFDAPWPQASGSQLVAGGLRAMRWTTSHNLTYSARLARHRRHGTCYHWQPSKALYSGFTNFMNFHVPRGSGSGMSSRLATRISASWLSPGFVGIALLLLFDTWS